MDSLDIKLLRAHNWRKTSKILYKIFLLSLPQKYNSSIISHLTRFFVLFLYSSSSLSKNQQLKSFSVYMAFAESSNPFQSLSALTVFFTALPFALFMVSSVIFGPELGVNCVCAFLATFWKTLLFNLRASGISQLQLLMDWLPTHKS